ncbi:MAG: hypothetical protein QM811_26185 [Pirellulales bacterium]
MTPGQVEDLELMQGRPAAVNAGKVDIDVYVVTEKHGDRAIKVKE